MRRNSYRSIVLICAVSILLANECLAQPSNLESVPTPAAPARDVQSVARTLQTYQAGKTTLEDFIRDAGLINATFPPPFDPGTNPGTTFLLKSNFRTTNAGPWKIYETGFTYLGSGLLGPEPSLTRKYVVGDTNKAICILAFGKGTKLTSISPVPVLNTSPETAPGQTNAPEAEHAVVSTPDLKTVAKTLKSYQVGKTTIEDFIRDANLATDRPFASSYLNPSPMMKSFGANRFTTPRGSPWRIYGTSIGQSILSNGVAITPVRIYVVGNTNKPIATLQFDGMGKLVSKSPPLPTPRVPPAPLTNRPMF